MQGLCWNGISRIWRKTIDIQIVCMQHLQLILYFNLLNACIGSHSFKNKIRVFVDYLQP